MVKGFAEAFADLNKLLKKFANTDSTNERFSLTDRKVHDALFAYKQIYKRNKEQVKQITSDMFQKGGTPPLKSLRQVLQGVVPEGGLGIPERPAPCTLLPPEPSGGTGCGAGRQGY